MALAVLGFASFEFAGHLTGSTGSTGSSGSNGSAAGARSPAARQAAARATASGAGATARATATLPAPTPATSPARPQATAAQLLMPVSAVAFGPAGSADGDNPQNADRVLTGSSGGWLTDWYTTASFGGLKTGTGLLLDMGRTVTITSVRLTLGGLPGASLELRLGTVPELPGLRVVKAATATGDVLTLRLARAVSARYVLLWFTRLPPDAAGTYQVSVRQVTVDGRR